MNQKNLWIALITLIVAIFRVRTGVYSICRHADK
jgi:hypothetical protein